MFLHNSAATTKISPLLPVMLFRSSLKNNNNTNSANDNGNDKSSDNKCSLVLAFTIYQAPCQLLCM